MSRAISMHIAVPQPAQGCCDKGTIDGAEASALVMKVIAAHAGFETRVHLVGDEATRAVVIDAVRKIAGELQAGDIFLLTFVGHGCLTPIDGSAAANRDLGGNSSWCLFDGAVLDNEVYDLLVLFQEGVRVLIVVESCHSQSSASAAASPVATISAVTARGTRTDQEIFEQAGLDIARAGGADIRRIRRYEALKVNASARTAQTQALAHGLLNTSVRVATTVAAQVVVLAACRDEQTAKDGTPVPVFTRALVDVWDGGRFRRDASKGYEAFMDEIRTLVQQRTSDQTPAWSFIGEVDRFMAQPPFTIEPPPA